MSFRPENSDKKSKITVAKIPDNIIADTYTYQLTDNAEKRVKMIIKIVSHILKANLNMVKLISNTTLRVLLQERGRRYLLGK